MATTQLDCVLHQLRKLIGVQQEADHSDGELLGRFLTRQDEAAFATLVRRHGPMVQRVCRRVLGNAHAAEDAFQATFLVLARRAASIRRHASLGGWLYEVAYHLAVRARADATRRDRHERRAVAVPRHQAPIDEREAVQTVIDEELERLPEKYRTPLVLCYLEGKTNAQAARELGWPTGSMASRLARGRNLLRHRLARRGVDLTAGVIAALLGENAAWAAVPVALVHNTVQAALLFAAGKTSGAGLVSAPAVVLAEGMVNTMIVTKLRFVAAIVLAISILGTGTSALIQHSVLTDAPASAERGTRNAEPNTEGDKPNEAPKGDVYGDMLPDGALARMGTLRWRHGGAVTFVGYMPDGKQLVTASQDGLCRVWGAATGKEIRRFGKGQPGAPGQLSAVDPFNTMNFGGNGGAGIVLSPDGQTLAVVGAKGLIQFWQTATGKEAGMVEQPGITGLAFTPDSKALATRGNDQKIRLWEVATAKEARTIQIAAAEESKPKSNPAANAEEELQKALIALRGGISGSATTMAFSADGKIVVLLGYEGNQHTGLIQICETATGKELHRVKAPATIGTAGMALARDGKTLAWSGGNGQVRLYDTETGKELRELGQQQQFTSYGTLLFSPDGKLLAGQANTSPAIRLWEVATGKELCQLGDTANPQQRVVVPLRRIRGSASPLFAFSPDGKLLAEGTPHRTVRLWEVATGKEVPPVSGHQGGVSALSVSPDGKVLTTYGADNTLRRWDTQTGKEVCQFRLPAGAANATFAADGKSVACRAGNGAVRVFDVASAKAIITVQVPAQGRLGGATALALSPDGKAVAVRGFDGAIRLFDTATGKERVAMIDTDPGNAANPEGVLVRGLGNQLPILAFSPDGSLLATGSTPNTGQPINRNAPPAAASAIQLWNAARGKKARQFETTAHGIQSLAFAPDGRTMVTANIDNTVSLWETLTGKECLTIKLDLGPAAAPDTPSPQTALLTKLNGVVLPVASLSIAIAADGRTLAVGSPDRAIRLFDLATGSELGKFTGHEGSVLSVAIAPDSRIVVSGSLDTTALTWDGGRFIPKDTPSVELTAQQVESLWNDLSGSAPQAFKAIAVLGRAPKQTPALCRERVKPAQGVEAKRIERLVADLDSKDFVTRQKATQELEKFAELAEPALRKLLATQPALETRQRIEHLLEQLITGQILSVEVLRNLRAVRVLEQLGTPEARQVLEALGKGAPGHKLTREAETSLKRLVK